MFSNLSILTILVDFVALLFALSVHEASHASAAYLMGDDTAARQGRMTLNPLAHIDPLGTVVLPLLGMFTGWRVLGWAKPVPVDTSRLTRRFSSRVGYALVAGAGPASNLLQSLVFLVALCLFVRWGLAVDPRVKVSIVSASMGRSLDILREVFSPGQVLVLALLGRLVIINVGLAIFNLLPFGPLDGAGILRGFLPWRWLPTFDRIQPAMQIVILVMFFVPVFGATLLEWMLMPFFVLAKVAYLQPLTRLLLKV